MMDEITKDVMAETLEYIARRIREGLFGETMTVEEIVEELESECQD